MNKRHVYPLGTPSRASEYLNTLDATFEISGLSHTRSGQEHHMVVHGNQRLEPLAVARHFRAQDIELTTTHPNHTASYELDGSLFDYIVYRERRNNRMIALARIVTTATIDPPLPRAYDITVDEVSKETYAQLAANSSTPNFNRPFKLHGRNYACRIKETPSYV